MNTRVIPVLLLQNNGLVKTKQFKNPVYVGDPINAIKIFNEKEVDELVFLDIDASKKKHSPNFKMLESIASECFMPLAYGGGIICLDEVKRILQIGIEKVVFNTSAIYQTKLITEAAKLTGCQSIVVSVDFKRNFFGNNKIFSHTNKSFFNQPLVDFVRKMEEAGAGELIINSVDQDGMMNGYDLDLIREVTQAVNIPVVACGGAGKLQHFKQAVLEAGAAAVAAGSLFVFHGPHNAVLINYPSQLEIKNIIK